MLRNCLISPLLTHCLYMTITGTIGKWLLHKKWNKIVYSYNYCFKEFIHLSKSMSEVQSGSCVQKCTIKYINKISKNFQNPQAVLVNMCLLFLEQNVWKHFLAKPVYILYIFLITFWVIYPIFQLCRQWQQYFYLPVLETGSPKILDLNKIHSRT